MEKNNAVEKNNAIKIVENATQKTSPWVWLMELIGGELSNVVIIATVDPSSNISVEIAGDKV